MGPHSCKTPNEGKPPSRKNYPKWAMCSKYRNYPFWGFREFLVTLTVDGTVLSHLRPVQSTALLPPLRCFWERSDRSSLLPTGRVPIIAVPLMGKGPVPLTGQVPVPLMGQRAGDFSILGVTCNGVEPLPYGCGCSGGFNPQPLVTEVPKMHIALTTGKHAQNTQNTK